MNLSYNAIQICKNKYGHGELCGISGNDFSFSEYSAPEDTAEVFDELLKAEMIELNNDKVNISALGQHLINMMISPDLFCMIDNDWLSVNVRIYIKDAFYLCVLENKLITSENDSARFTIELLPGFNHIVGAYVYALYDKSTEDSDKNSFNEIVNNPEENPDFQITGFCGDSKLNICGNIIGNTMCYKTEEIFGGKEIKPSVTESDVSTLVNIISGWMFKNLSVFIEFKENNYVTDKH